MKTTSWKRAGVLNLAALILLVLCAPLRSQELTVLHQTTTPIQTNAYLIYDKSSREAALIDPGGPIDSLLKAIDDNDLKLKYVFITHAHSDHVAGIPVVRAKFLSARLGISTEEIEDTKLYAQWATKLPAEEVAKMRAVAGGAELADFDYGKLHPDIVLAEGQTYPLGRLEIRTFLAPGHSRGSICFAAANALFTGDVLSYRRTGRTDLPGGGGPEVMARSVRRLYALFPDVTVVYPGHGQFTDIGSEKKENTKVREDVR